MSVPVATNAIPVATATADPPLDPPGECSGLRGFRMVPKCGLSDVIPYASSCRPAFPTMTAPASASFSTTAASRSGTKSAKIFDPEVVRTPLVHIRSLCAIGMPCSGPRSMPWASSRSSSSARASADSPVTVMNAFRTGLSLRDLIQALLGSVPPTKPGATAALERLRRWSFGLVRTEREGRVGIGREALGLARRKASNS